MTYVLLRSIVERVKIQIVYPKYLIRFNLAQFIMTSPFLERETLMLRRDRLGGKDSPVEVSYNAKQQVRVDDAKMGVLARRYRDRMIQEVDLEGLLELSTQLRRTRVERLIARMIREEGVVLSQAERDYLVGFIVNEVVGLGPLEKLINNPLISEIMVNGPREVFVEINGRILKRPDIQFSDGDHIRHIIDRIVAPIGRRIDESNPYVDARLEDGSRVNAIIPPLSLNGPVLTIRRFRQEPFVGENMVENGTMTWQMLDFLRSSVVGKLNILISGGTGSGKTTMLNVLGSFIPDQDPNGISSGERLVVIEDSAELQIHRQHTHVLRQESRPPNVEGEGEVTIRQLLKNALRMRPDRIIVGEVRGAEALDMLQAMNTGHEGSMTTIHANSPREAFSRLETMVMWAEGTSELPFEVLRENIVSALDIVIQTERMQDGRRVVTSISEVQGVKKGKLVIRPIFIFERVGTDPKTGVVEGHFTPTGHIPKILSRLRGYGVELDEGIFVPDYLIKELGDAILYSDDVTEIMINGPKNVFIEEKGKISQRNDIKFRDNEHLLGVMNMIVAPLGRRLTESNPIVDARLPDGSRVNAIIPPASVDGPAITIRRFPAKPLRMEDLIKSETLTTDMQSYLRAAVGARLNILISGGTGSGKTTILNALSGFIPGEERLVTIEDVAELQLQQNHVVRLEARPPDEYSEGEVSIRDLVRNALRMRPTRIIVGEVRGEEALDMLQAMNTGHHGSLSTIHANSPEDAFSRLETMVLWAGVNFSSDIIHTKFLSVIDVVVQLARLEDGSRKIVEITEHQKNVTQDKQWNSVFSFKQNEITPKGKIIGKHQKGNKSLHTEYFKTHGFTL